MYPSRSGLAPGIAPNLGNTMRTVYEAAHLIDAHLVKHALEQAGIPAFVRGEALVGGLGELGVFGLVAVMVADAAVPRARAVIAALGLDALGEEDVPAADGPAGMPEGTPG